MKKIFLKSQVYVALLYKSNMFAISLYWTNSKNSKRLKFFIFCSVQSQAFHLDTICTSLYPYIQVSLRNWS